MEIKPLNAIIYNKDKVDMKDVIAPPYDVIDDCYQDELYKRSPYNVVRLILARGENRYEDAKTDFLKWQEENILIKTDKPVIFYIVQKYKTENGKEVERKGFIARNKIEPFEKGTILPHEFTMGGPKADRLNLVKSCKAFFSQIFMVYQDKTMLLEDKIGKIIRAQKPYIDVVDDKNVENIVWIIDDSNIISQIQEMMKDKTLLIADGHHRYETSMNYSKISDNPEAQYVMSYFTNLEDENLIIFPTHRIITKMVEPYILIEAVKKYYDVIEIDFTSENKAQKKAEFLNLIEAENKNQITTGLYMKNVNKFYVLKLKKDAKDKIDAPDVLKNLDLTALHELIITKELNFTHEAQMAQDGIKYIKQKQIAFDMIDCGTAWASFIMAYPKMADIKAVSGAGYKMPQKSTYFYPKLLSGVVINPL